MGSKESNKEKMLQYLQLNWPDSLLADGYDSAIVGVAGGHDSGRVVYSIPKMIETCMEWAGSYEEAVEWLEFNTLGAYVGENTPIYTYLVGHDDLE
jgi:hypothetical protein